MTGQPPGDRFREGFQRSRRYTNNLSDTKYRTCHPSMNATSPDKAITEEISGLIERVTFHNDENGFCVLRVKVRGHRDEVTVLGSLPSVTAGEWLQAEGWWVRDKEHGLQFKARLMKTVPPTTVEGIERYLSSGLVKGIGPVLAKKLVGVRTIPHRLQFARQLLILFPGDWVSPLETTCDIC